MKIDLEMFELQIGSDMGWIDGGIVERAALLLYQPESTFFYNILGPIRLLLRI
jgi:hypothetical protein